MKKLEMLKILGACPLWASGMKELAEMPFDKRFNGELYHATGYSFKDEYGIWWNEYSNGIKFGYGK